MMAAAKAGLAKIVAALGGGMSAIWAAIQGAGLIGLIKVGLIAGVSIAVIVLIFKFLKNKWDMYTNKNNETVTTAALGRNYADVREQDKLHPLMKDVKKNLRKDLKPKKKKGHKHDYARDIEREYYRGKRNVLYREDDFVGTGRRDQEREYKKFLRTYGKTRYYDEEADRTSLRRIWNF